MMQIQTHILATHTYIAHNCTIASNAAYVTGNKKIFNTCFETVTTVSKTAVHMTRSTRSSDQPSNHDNQYEGLADKTKIALLPGDTLHIKDTDHE